MWPKRPIPFITHILINQALVEKKTFRGLKMQVSTYYRCNNYVAKEKMLTEK